MRLEFLFDAELRYADLDFLGSVFGGEEGMAFGNGVATFSGSRLQGEARWSNFPRRREDGVFLANVTGALTTHDGAQVLFHFTGYSLASGGVRRITSPVTFIADSDRYRWLNSIVGMSEGLLSVEDGASTIRLRCYACINEMVERE